MGYIWIFDLLMLIVEIPFWRGQRKESEQAHRPLPKIIGSVPHVPLKKQARLSQQSFNGRCATF